jgi:hypothetical protein
MEFPLKRRQPHFVIRFRLLLPIPIIRCLKGVSLRLGYLPREECFKFHILNGVSLLGSSMLDLQPGKKEESMKKAKSELNDWARPEYKRSDLGEVVRGKYASRIRASTNVIVLDPQVAKAFPNDKAVNDALRGLLKLARSSARPTNNK